MIERGWCPYCQVNTSQQTELVHNGLEDKYETTCCSCHKLLKWHLVGIKKKEEEL